MKPFIRTAAVAVLAIFMAVPVFAQNPRATWRRGAAVAQNRARGPQQRRVLRQGRRGRPAVRSGRIFKRLDKDANGSISRQEWTRNPKAFDRLDRNKDGQLTRDELRRPARRRR